MVVLNHLPNLSSKMETYQVCFYKTLYCYTIYRESLLKFNFIENPNDRYLPPDWDHFHTLFEQMLHRMPSLRNANLEMLCNGPEAFSPDCKWIVGETPEIRNYFIAAGMKTV